MASTNKTDLLGLNQWVLDDAPKMDDFNLDNAKIDNAIKNINTDIESNTDKIGDLSANGLTEANLATAIKNDRTQLSDMAQDRIYYCGTTSGTNTYTATNSKITAYTPGLTVRVMIGTVSTGASTLNINNLGAIPILDSLGKPITSGGLKNGLPYQLCYNGANFIVLGKGGGGNATADKVLSPYTVTTDAGQITGTMPNHSGTDSPANSIAGTGVGRIYVRPQAGYYDGSVASYVDDGNFAAANIVSGKSIFGLSGNASIESLGGRKFISGTFDLTNATTIYLPFNPSIIQITTPYVNIPKGTPANQTEYYYWSSIVNTWIYYNVTSQSFGKPSAFGLSGNAISYSGGSGATGTGTYYAWE